MAEGKIAPEKMAQETIAKGEMAQETIAQPNLTFLRANIFQGALFSSVIYSRIIYSDFSFSFSPSLCHLKSQSLSFFFRLRHKNAAGACVANSLGKVFPGTLEAPRKSLFHSLSHSSNRGIREA